MRQLHDSRKHELRQQQELEEEKTRLFMRISALETQLALLESALKASREETEDVRVAKKEVEAARATEQQHVRNLTSELEDRHMTRQTELEAVEDRYIGITLERDAARSEVEFMAERQRQFQTEARHQGETNAELQLEVKTLKGQLEALEATLKLLTVELQETLQKESMATAKLTLCQKDAASMQKSIDDAKLHVLEYQKELNKSQHENQRLQAHCTEMASRLYQEQNKRTSHTRTSGMLGSIGSLM